MGENFQKVGPPPPPDLEVGDKGGKRVRGERVEARGHGEDEEWKESKIRRRSKVG